MAGFPILRLKWVYAIYLDVTSLKGVSSMKLHRDIGITQKPHGTCNNVFVMRLRAKVP